MTGRKRMKRCKAQSVVMMQGRRKGREEEGRKGRRGREGERQGGRKRRKEGGREKRREGRREGRKDIFTFVSIKMFCLFLFMFSFFVLFSVLSYYLFL